MSRRGIAAVGAALVAGAALLWWGTGGFTIFTAETARRADVARQPRPLPPIRLEDQNGHPASFSSMAGKVVLMDFVYTRCPTVCSVLGAGFEQLRARIRREGLQDRILLVTFSFDPEHDGPAELSAYAERFGGADAGWRFVRAPSRRQTDELLRATELVAVPDGAGGFVHNAAIHIVDRRGRVVRIVDSDAFDEAFEIARKLA